jgi:hypothetical protein
MQKHQDIIRRAQAVFDSPEFPFPPMTLRAGNAVDDYELPPPFDAEIDRIDDAYLEHNHWGIAFLDAVSWQFYLPALMSYAFRHLADGGSMVIDSLLMSMRPPDREPPRLSSLTRSQEDLVVSFLEVLAFDDTSAWQLYAMQVLEEYRAPKALYRR